MTENLTVGPGRSGGAQHRGWRRLPTPARIAAVVVLAWAPVFLASGSRPPAPDPWGALEPAEADSLATGDIEHGRYLVEQVVMCAECHSARDEEGAIIEEQRLMGGPIPVRPPWPNDWAERAPRNRGLPGYTVKEGIRLLTEGAIAADGRQLRPPMPRFRMTREDATDVVAYLKSLE